MRLTLQRFVAEWIIMCAATVTNILLFSPEEIHRCRFNLCYVSYVTVAALGVCLYPHVSLSFACTGLKYDTHVNKPAIEMDVSEVPVVTSGLLGGGSVLTHSDISPFSRTIVKVPMC